MASDSSTPLSNGIACPVCNLTLTGSPLQQTKHIGDCITNASVSVGDMLDRSR